MDNNNQDNSNDNDNPKNKDKEENSDFAARLKAAQAGFAKEGNEGKNKAQDQGAERSSRAGSEFLANIFAGALIGYLIDSFFNTEPWGLIFMMVMGFVSGVYRANAAMKKNNDNQ